MRVPFGRNHPDACGAVLRVAEVFQQESGCLATEEAPCRGLQLARGEWHKSRHLDTFW